MRARADELGVSRELISELAGLPSGYAGKVIGPGQVKRVGMTSLGALVGWRHAPRLESIRL